MRQTIPPRFGVIAVLSTVVILFLIIGLAVVGSLVQPETGPTQSFFQEPHAAIQPEIVDPALAIAQLGGLSEVDVVEQAIRQARPGTALATLLYSPNIEARDSAGYLLLLGNTFASREDISRAQLAYRLAGSLAALSPDLSDTTRADIFLQAGDGLAKVDDIISAKIYFDQAFLLATESNYLQAAYRGTVLARTSEGYRSLGLREEARRSLDLSVTPANLTALPETPLVLPVGEPILWPQEIQGMETTRWQMAQAVVTELVNTGGQVRPATVNALQNALLVEDQLKIQYFADSLASEAQLSGKINILQAKINWQSTKYRVARGGFGISLVPTWEAQREQLRTELSDSFEALYDIYADIIVAIPNIADIDRATEEAIRRQLLAGVQGQYPDYPREELRSQLLQASARLIETQPGTKLRLSYLTVDNNNNSYYVFISDTSLTSVEPGQN